jgi:hypothetical protein
MAYAMKLSELKNLSDKELEKIYDAHTGNTVVGLDFFREEILKREQTRLTNAMIKLTRFIIILTIVQVIATIITLLTIFLQK